MLCFLIITALGFTFIAFYSGPTDDWHYMMGPYNGWWMWIGGFLFVIFLIALIYLIATAGQRGGGQEGQTTQIIQPHQESALEVLKKRYAKGEITQEEFERMKKELEQK